MIDLHTHTLLSDGELIASELVRRAETIGYRAIAITDHVDFSNYDFVSEKIAQFCKNWDDSGVTVIPGVEITHAKPAKIGELAEKCRKHGAKIVVVHGETIVEPVMNGTNKAAIEAGVDILAHPGLISDADAKLAAAMNVALEISGRGGHSFTNGHVLAQARRHGARMVFCTDTHAPRDLMDEKTAINVAKGAGMTDSEVENMFKYASTLVEQLS